MKKATTWTPERVDYFSTHYPTMMTNEDILAGLNAIGGAPFVASIQALRDKGKEMKLVRPAEYRAQQAERLKAINSGKSVIDNEGRKILKDHWETEMSSDEIVRMVRERCGSDIPYETIRKLAQRMGLRRPIKKHAEIDIPAAVEKYNQVREIKGAFSKGSIEYRHARAKELLRKKTDPLAVAGACGLPLREVYRFIGEIRMEKYHEEATR